VAGEQRPIVTPPPHGRLRLVKWAVAGAAAVAVVAGLALRGLPGAVLLVLIALALVSLSVRVWPALAARQRSVRALVVLALLVLAGIKAAGHA
jgi:hypothetical protein